MQKPVYLSKEGLEKTKKELDELKTVRRREVADRIEKAKEMGDLRENAEYHDAKDEKAFIEGRIAELQDMVNRASVIEATDDDSVGLGSTVRVSYDGKEKELLITGSTEADPLKGKISNESPIGQALIGKAVGDEVEVEVPSGTIRYTILSIT